MRRGYWYRSSGLFYLVAFDLAGSSQTWEFSALAALRKFATKEGYALTSK